MTEKPRILFILHLPPPVHGAAMVGKYIHDSDLINAQFDCHYVNLAIASSLEDIGKVGVKKFWHFIQLLCTIKKEVKQVKPDLVYITPNAKGGAFYKEWIIVMMLKMMDCRIVAHYHNKGVSERQNKWVDNWLYRRFFKNLKVILLSEALYPDMQKYVERKDVYICPNGIPVTDDVKKFKASRKDNDVPRLLFLSNLLIDKGVLVLLDALRILKDEGRSFVCDFVGGETADIDAKRFEEEVKRRGLNDFAVYKGKKYGTDKAEEFESADIFVLPSFNEAFPLVNLEAMSYGLPIVSTNVGGVTEAIRDGENGLICDVNNPDSLARSIEALLNDEGLRQRMGEKGYHMFKVRFTEEAFLNRISDALSDVAGVGNKE